VNHNITVETNMDPTIERFVREHCQAAPDARCKLRQFVVQFRETIAHREAKCWPRWRIRREVEREYPIGVGSHGVEFICGLSFEPAQRWAVVDGKARRVPA
jgi:hypothetical protein